MSRKIVILCLTSLLILVSMATSVFVEESKAATEITFQYIGGTVPNVDGVINEAIDKFQQENPGITVKTIYVDWGNSLTVYELYYGRYGP
ncbi:hypothetical protein MUO79_01265 [Candidatus Bathyarchaeota archaeon]|nr:hypothetical protein [Candidatus Bathyarchaeota archaeon]